MPPTNIWGPIYWKFLHNVTTLYPDNPTQQDKYNFIDFLNSFRNLLPCKECREHFTYNLNILPLSDNILSSKYNLILWGINMHNVVRKMLGKYISHKDSIETVEAEIKKNMQFDTKKLLGNVMFISITEITLNYKASNDDFKVLFNTVNGFLIQKNINLEDIFQRKKITISFNRKNDALVIANILR